MLRIPFRSVSKTTQILRLINVVQFFISQNISIFPPSLQALKDVLLYLLNFAVPGHIVSVIH